LAPPLGLVLLQLRYLLNLPRHSSPFLYMLGTPMPTQIARRAAPQASSTILFVGAGARASWSATARKNLSRQRGGTTLALGWTMTSCSGVNALAMALAAPPLSVLISARIVTAPSPLRCRQPRSLFSHPTAPRGSGGSR